MRSAVLSCLAWLGFVGAALIAALSDILPAIPGYVRPANLYHYLVCVQLFFVLVLWPLAIPRSPLVPTLAMLLFGLPFALLCRTLSEAGIRTLAVGQLLVAVSASFVAVLFSRGWKIASWYYLCLLLASAGLPFAYYLALESSGVSTGFLAVLSPFWAASRMESGATVWILCALLAGGTIALTLTRSKRDPTADPPAAGP